MSSKSLYDGLHPGPKLVVGLHVGHSLEASYCILRPGDTPIIQGVNRYPGQEKVDRGTKIPALLYYDSRGYVRAVGVEALWESTVNQARTERWIKVEWSHLYFSPKTYEDTGIPPLPLNKTAEEVFSNFLQYLYRCTQMHVREMHPDSHELLDSHMDFVLAHPNDCGPAQQQQMYRAAIHARLVPDTPIGRSRIKLVTDGEAVLHYCIYNHLALDIITSGEGITIVDAGEGIELSSFHMKNSPNKFKAIAPPICDSRGSLSVTRHARVFIENKLYNSRYGSSDDIDVIMECFDKTNKLLFKDATQATHIKFGTDNDTDAFVDIKFGQLRLQGLDMASFFKPSIGAIQEAIQEQVVVAEVPVTSVLLVGSLAASEWLFSNLRTHLHGKGLRLYRPDSPIAISEGALFSLDCFVSGEMKSHGLKPPTTNSMDHHLIAELETRNRKLEQAFNDAERWRDEYRIQAQAEREKAETLAFQLRTWEMEHTSCEDRIMRLTEEVSRLPFLVAKIGEHKSELDSISDIAMTWQAEAEKQRKEATGRFHEVESLRHELKRRTQEAQERQQHIDRLTAELRQLTLTQQLPSPADADDVRRLVERLNNEIIQCAAHLRSAVTAESASSNNLVDVSTKPYTGTHRKMIISMDVGTTYSGVSYCILDPGNIPIIQGVNRYPAQQKVGGNAKIPSILYYDNNGLVRAVGAEVLQESTIDQATEHQWVKVQWFKLHLRAQSETYKDEQVPPLPPNKTIVQVFGDFLRYLYHSTRSYIQQTHASGLELWESLTDDIRFVLTHPNGWKSGQKIQMQKAALYGGLIPDTPEGRSRLCFLQEGEASLHYCIQNNLSLDVTKTGEGIIIVDAGGGTIDLSTYHVKGAEHRYVEIAPATCYFQGSVFVSRRAQTFLKNKLAGSRYDTPEDIALLAECFDKTTKLSFKDSGQPAYIKFGSARETDLSVDIKRGQLKLQGSDVATFFEPSISTLQQAIQQQINVARVPVTSVLLVGGFSASSWLFSDLHNYLSAKHVRLSRPDGHLAKAVANGAVAFLVNRLMTAGSGGMNSRDIPDQEGTMDENAAQIRESVGEPVLHLLQAARTMDDPSMIVMIAVQACLISFCYNLVSYSSHQPTDRVKGAFHELFKVLCTTVASPIAAQWSGLTKRDLERLNASQDPTDFTSQVTRLMMLEKLSAIVLYMGYPDEGLTDELSSHLKSITTSCLELRRVLLSAPLSKNQSHPITSRYI